MNNDIIRRYKNEQYELAMKWLYYLLHQHDIAYKKIATDTAYTASQLENTMVYLTNKHDYSWRASIVQACQDILESERFRELNATLVNGAVLYIRLNLAPAIDIGRRVTYQKNTGHIIRYDYLDYLFSMQLDSGQIIAFPLSESWSVTDVIENH